MAPMELWHFPKSRSSRAVFALEECGAKAGDGYTLHLIEGEIPPFNPALKTPEFLAINPQGTVPTLRLDAGYTLTESGAIVQYVLETLDTKHRLHPEPGSPDRAAYLQLSWWAEDVFTANVVVVLMQKKFVPEDKKDAAALEKALAKVAGNLDLLERQLEAHDFVLSSGLSGVDMMLSLPLNLWVAWLEMLDEAKYPRIAAYWKRITALPSFKAAY